MSSSGGGSLQVPATGLHYSALTVNTGWDWDGEPICPQNSQARKAGSVAGLGQAEGLKGRQTLLEPGVLPKKRTCDWSPGLKISGVLLSSLPLFFFLTCVCRLLGVIGIISSGGYCFAVLHQDASA